MRVKMASLLVGKDGKLEKNKKNIPDHCAYKNIESAINNRKRRGTRFGLASVSASVFFVPFFFSFVIVFVNFFFFCRAS